MISHTSRQLVVILERFDCEDESELQVTAILGGAPGKGGNLGDAEWLARFVDDFNGVENAIFDGEIPPEIKNETVVVVIGHMVAERIDCDLGTDYDAYFAVDKIMTEHNAVEQLTKPEAQKT